MAENDKKIDGKDNAAGHKIENPFINNDVNAGRKYKTADLSGLKIHYLIIIFAIVITIVFSLHNQVSVTEALKRGFYAGAAFWVIAEIIDYILCRQK